MKSIVKNPSLAASGAERMKWFRERMPIVAASTNVLRGSRPSKEK